MVGLQACLERGLWHSWTGHKIGVLAAVCDTLCFHNTHNSTHALLAVVGSVEDGGFEGLRCLLMLLSCLALVCTCMQCTPVYLISRVWDCSIG